ncbi:unnamed protein product [Musa textilis]
MGFLVRSNSGDKYVCSRSWCGWHHHRVPWDAAAYRRNTCSKLGDQAPSYMSPVPVGGLLQIMDPQALPPTLAPMPSLHAADVVEPPLPAVSPKPSSFGAVEESGLPPSQPSYGRHLVALIFLSSVMLCGSLPV